MPASLKVAVVSTAVGLANSTVPGPLSFDQAWVTVAGGFGSPSSVTVALRTAPPGSVMPWSAPASTEGAELTGTGKPLVACEPLSMTVFALPVSMLDEPFQPRPDAMNDQEYEAWWRVSSSTP